MPQINKMKFYSFLNKYLFQQNFLNDKTLIFPCPRGQPLEGLFRSTDWLQNSGSPFPAKGKRKVKARAEAKPDRTEIQIQANPSQKHSQTRAKAKAWGKGRGVLFF